MQATGQYGEVPPYVGSRVGASHGHMFNLSHEMSLSSTASTGQGQGQAGAVLGHGHGLSLSHPPHSQASQSHMPSQVLSTPSVQPSFLQSHQPSQSHHQHHPQQAQHGFNMSMGGAAPKTSPSAPLPPLTHQQVLQSAAQQLQADIKQHQEALHSPRSPRSQQQAIIGGEHVQQRNLQNPQPGTGDQGNEQRQPQQQLAVVQSSAPSARAELAEIGTIVPHGLNVSSNKGVILAKEESLDGDEQDDEGDKGSGGNRWPRQEALALLKIRSEMDAAFKDSSIKGPLWEEISRKLAEMGYHRSAKKCKEKFENVHKYYKRTKEGKTGRQDGKNYRFFSQLEALYGKTGDSSALINLSTKSPNNNNINSNSNTNYNTSNNTSNSGLLSLNHGDNGSAGLGLMNAPMNSILNTGSTNQGIMNLSAAFPPPFNATSAAAAATNAHIARTLERVESFKHGSENSGALHCFIETSDDDDDDDDEDDEDDEDDDEFDEPAHETTAPTAKITPNSKKRKRKPIKKYLAFFEKVMKKVLDKQEQMQEKFLEALERRDQDRMIREEAWKRQEMARLNREQDVRAAERALSVSREASLVALLQKMTGQSVPLPQTSIAFQPTNQPSTALVPADYMQNDYNSGDKDAYDPMNKRWPKPEVLALIKLRTSLDRRFHEPGSKAVLWEEISAGMTAEGFARTSKRCKEKWENINKYFKKAKDSKKKRPENAKTCPYFHHLNALYKEGLLGGGCGGVGGGGGSSMSSKHLAVRERGEDQSEGVTEDLQGTMVTSNINGGGSGLAAQEGDSEVVPNAKEINVAVSSFTPPIAGMPASIPGTSTASTDAKMHMFMGSVKSEKDASGRAVNDVLPLAMDTSASGNGRAGIANPPLFNLDQGMGASSKGFAQQQEHPQAG